MLFSPASVDPPRLRDALLAVLALAAGSVDALAWLGLGKVFSAFMTGNVVFVAVGFCSHDSGLVLHAATALGAFGAGAWATAMVMPRQAPEVLWPRRVTAGLLGVALAQLGFWVVWAAVGGHPNPSLSLLLLAVSALAMGIQTATAVALGVHAVFTTAATATWTVLAGDAAHWSATRIERRRLAMVLAGTLLGAVVGALLLRHCRVWMPLLPALVTAGVALVARHTVQRQFDPTRITVSTAHHPLKRGFGRSAGETAPMPHGR
jgi:uncharacterized membrane protein YoaK (UPF0700 family)